MVGISGGAESAVAAALLKSEGYQVQGLYLAQGMTPEASSSTVKTAAQQSGVGAGEQARKARCLRSDAETARRICAKIGIPLQVADVSDEFHDKVVDHLVHEAIQSRSMDPCVPCHSSIRLGWLARKADELGYRWIATGHYAQLAQDAITGLARLQRAVDAQADQSFLLWGLNQKVLSRLVLPLGGLSRGMVRKLADQFGIPVREPCDPASGVSCLGDDAAVIRLVESSTPAGLRVKGMTRTSEGKVVGSHLGLHRFRVGQKVGGLDLPTEGNKSYFVLGFDLKTHGLIVGPEEKLLAHEVLALGVNWIRPVDGLRPLRCSARIVPWQPDVACWVTPFENGTVHVRFDQPQRALSPGQAIVFSDADEILGGAWVES